MSLSRPAVAFGGLIVVGCAIAAGTSAAAASNLTKPQPLATVTVGKGFKTSEPNCYNGGKALSSAEQSACQQNAAKADAAGKLPSINVRPGDSVSVGMDVKMAKKGWDAFTNGGSNGQAVLASWTNNSTFSGQTRASEVLGSSTRTLLTVVSMDRSSHVYGVWYFELKNRAA